MEAWASIMIHTSLSSGITLFFVFAASQNNKGDGRSLTPPAQRGNPLRNACQCAQGGSPGLQVFHNRLMETNLGRLTEKF